MPHFGPGFIFYGIPKTGSTWCRYAMEAMKIPVHRDGDYHAPPSHVDPERREGKVEFCFVRHPVDWLRSFWAMRMHDYGPMGSRLNPREMRQRAEEAMTKAPFVGSVLCGDGFYYPPDHLLSVDFDLFCQNVLEESPGYVTALYKKFVSDVMYVGRTEHLREDLLTALSLAGIHCNDWVEPPKAQPAAPDVLAKAELSKWTYSRICEAEQWIIDTFYKLREGESDG